MTSVVVVVVVVVVVMCCCCECLSVVSPCYKREETSATRRGPLAQHSSLFHASTLFLLFMYILFYFLNIKIFDEGANSFFRYKEYL